MGQRSSLFLMVLGVVGVLLASIGVTGASAAKEGVQAWESSIRELPLPGEGCFDASYPAVTWQSSACSPSTNRAFVPVSPGRAATLAAGLSAFAIGNGKDYSAEVNGSLEKVTGSFTYVTPGTTESSVEGPNTYSLQLNTSFFQSPVCAGALVPANCRGWEQFLYSVHEGGVFIQYWLLNYGNPCPAGWFTYLSDCYRNDPAGVTAIAAPLASELEHVTLSGAVSGATASCSSCDEVVMTTGTGQASASGAASILGLAGHWSTVEWAIVGDGGGTQAVFSAGTKLNVRTTVHYGSTTRPTCVYEGFTGETNNLELVNSPALTTQLAPTMETEQTRAPGTPKCVEADGKGDTHLTTFNKLLYDYQAAGQYTLATTGPNFDVQTQQVSGAPNWPNADVNHAIAAKLGSHTVAVCSTPQKLAVDGTTTELGSGEHLSLTDGDSVTRQGNVYLIQNETGDSVRAEVNSGTPNWINVSVGLGRWPEAVRGLLASASNNPNAVESLGGTVFTPEFELKQFYGSYGKSWRVATKQSLLAPCGPTVKPSNAKAPFYAGNLDPKVAAAARAVCVENGIAVPALLDACTVDVAVLGAGAADAYREVEAPAYWGKITAGSGSGKHVVLSTSGKGELTVGSKILTTSHNLVFTTAAGNLECETVELEGTLSVNGASKDTGTVTSSLSYGNYLEIPGACKTSATGPVFTVSEHLPWESAFSSKGGEVKGKKVTLTMTFLAIEPPNKCTFEAAKMKLTYATPLTSTGQEESLVATAQKFKHATKAPEQTSLCPAEGTLGGDLAATSGGEAVLYSLQ